MFAGTKSAKTYGFTLIELLVVIAIISLLIAILLPSLTKARNLAKSAACMSTLKGIALSHEFYMQDNGGNFLYAAYSASAGFWWWKAIRPYMEMKEDSDEEVPLLQCPADPTEGGLLSKGGAWPDTSIRSALRGYNYSGMLFWYGYKKPEQVSRPSDTIAFGDSDWWRIGTNCLQPLNPWAGETGAGSVYTLQFSYTRHDEKINLVMADQHIQPELIDDILVEGDKYYLWKGEE